MPATPGKSSTTGSVEVHYWAAARAAAGVATESVDAPVSLAALVSELGSRHEGLEKVLHVCSVLRDGEQLRGRDPETVVLESGTTVEFLPPFAGG